jgi:ABC-2 type transport system ATP-binding protein
MSILCAALTKQYHRGQAALSELTLSVEPGSVFALLGRNGAGKSTAIQLLVDLLRPTSGEARIIGIPSTRLRPQDRQRIGYVSENQQLPGWMRVGEFVEFLRPMYPAWNDALTAQLMKLFALPLEQKLHQLSRGQRMKAAFLGALCYEPEVLILDEPFSGLDSAIRQDLLDAMITFLGDGNRTVLLSSHDIEEVSRLTDRIGVLERGQLALHGNVDDLLARAREVTFATSFTSAVSPLPDSWWNVVSGPLGSTFTATDVSDDAALASAVKQLWPDASQLTIRPTGLSRFYVDFLRHSEPQTTSTTAA